jgi:hypothetical protein
VTATPPPGPFEQPPPGAPTGPWASDTSPARAGVDTAADSRPEPIALAVKLMYAGAALSAIGALLTLLQRSAIEDSILDADSSLTESELDSAVAVAMAFGVVIGLIGAGIWLWMASANGQGKRWARTVATVLGGLNVLFTLLGLAGMNSSTGPSNVIGVVSAVLAAVILYLLWRPESTRFYDTNSPRR